MRTHLGRWNIRFACPCKQKRKRSNIDSFLFLRKKISQWNLNSVYVKIGEPLTKAWKLSTVSRPLCSLKCVPWNSFELKDLFCCTNVKIKFKFFRSDYEISEMKQKWDTRIELHVQRRTNRVLYRLPK